MSKIKHIIKMVDIFIIRAFIALLIGLGLFIIFLIFILSYNNCPKEQMSTITNLSDLDFEIVAVECSNVWANVFVSKTGTNQKTLIFVFDPVLIKNNRYVPPSIVVYDHDITISIERIAEIISKEDRWNDYDIHYQIDYMPDLRKPDFGKADGASGVFGPGAKP